MNVPGGLYYSADHEWVRVSDDTAREGSGGTAREGSGGTAREGSGGTALVGITDYAQDALGDVVYVDLPEVGRPVAAGTSFGEVESTKSVSDLYAPVSGEITEVNDDLADEPERLNSDPYGEGWICRIAMSDPSELGELLDAAEYSALIDG